MFIIRRCIIAAIICGMTVLAASGQDKAKNLYYIINYTITHCNADVDLNGVPLTRTEKDTAYSITGTTDVGRWIVPGANVITVTIRPPEGKPGPDDRRSIEISMSTAEKGQMSDEGIKIAALRIPEKEGDTSLASIKQTVKKELRFTPASVPPSELWARSKPEKLDDAAREEILRLVRDYHGAYVKKDQAKLYDMLLFATLEASRNRYFTADEAREMLKNGLKEMFADKSFAMEPLKADQIILKPIAGGRVIWVTDARNETPLRSKKMKDGGYMEFPVYAARLDGKWMIVR
jgi:hypothetical protein